MIVMIDLRKSQLTGQGHHQVGWSSALSSSSSSSGRLTDALVARGNPQVGWATTGDSLCLLIIKRMIVFFTAEYVKIKLQDNATYTQPLDQNSLQNWVDPRLPQRYTTIVTHVGGDGGSIVDRVFVSVSEWLFGSFVVILFGDYVYLSCFKSHISKEWDGNAV